ncbi:MAG: BrnT family toxin [Nitrococcus sp.]|nr:BrnT family toxin [Nitrococcus sp.]
MRPRRCEAVSDGYTLTMEDDRWFDYGEPRLVTLGLLNGRVVAIAHTETEHVIRIISIRKATKREQQFYFENLKD